MGTNNLVNLSSNVQMKQVKEMFVYPSYIQGEFDYDIALLKTELFATTDYVRSVCVPSLAMDPIFSNGTICTIAGFGVTKENGLFISLNLLLNINPIPYEPMYPTA